MYLEKAKELIDKEYELRRAENTGGFRLEVMDEKIKHSYQVLGVGNYLLKHEPYFANFSEQEKDCFRAAALLHDIGRFYEILKIGQGVRVDHGVHGAEMLRQIPDFCADEVVLPVRHHGHLIEALYEDEEYQALSDEMKDKVKHITFLVRDADKLANFYLLVLRFKEMSPMFFVESCFKNPHDKCFSEAARGDFFAHRTVLVKNITNFAEKALGYLSWIYDLNYTSSFVFMEKLNIVSRMEKLFAQYFNEDEAKVIYAELDKYVCQKKR